MDSTSTSTNELSSRLEISGTIIHLRGWRWQDIMNNMQAIKDAGYTAILLSPHTKTCGGEWSDGYDPYDYANFNSDRFGSEYDLGWLVRTAHYFGLQIYADMVMNHMCASTPSAYSYPHFNWNDFHHNGQMDINNSSQWETFDLYGMNDLAHESPYVRSELFNFVVKTNNMGFDGYRWDAAKHVPLWFWQDHIVNNVNSWGKYNFAEVYDGRMEVLNPYINAGMAVTDYSLYNKIRDNFRYGGDLSQMDGAGVAGQNGPSALTFVQNHDVNPPENRILAYAFLAAYPGYPCFYDVSIHDSVINNLVWIHNTKAKGRYLSRYRDRTFLIFERENHLLAGINQSGNYVNQWVSTTWNNTRLHDYAGHSPDKWTNQSGWVEVSIPPMSYVMLAP
jgi:alpha-amylase